MPCTAKSSAKGDFYFRRTTEKAKKMQYLKEEKSNFSPWVALQFARMKLNQIKSKSQPKFPIFSKTTVGPDMPRAYVGLIPSAESSPQEQADRNANTNRESAGIKSRLHISASTQSRIRSPRAIKLEKTKLGRQQSTTAQGKNPDKRSEARQEITVKNHYRTRTISGGAKTEKKKEKEKLGKRR